MSSRSDALIAPLGRLRATQMRGLGPFQIGSLLLVLLAMAVIGDLIFTKIWGSGQPAAVTYAVGTVARQTITSVTNASGTVSATRQVKLSFPTAGRVAHLSVQQGDTVTAGQEIAALDTSTLQIKRDTAQSQLQAAQARLQALIDGPTAADIAAQQQVVATAQSNLTRAQNDLTNILTGITPDDVAAARANLDRAAAALNVAQTNYDKLARGEDLTLRPEYTALQGAKADFQTAQTNYTNKTVPNPSDLAAAQAAVAGGRSAVDAAQAKLSQLLNPNPADVSSAQSAVASAQAQLDAANAKYASVFIGGTLADRQAAQAAVDAAQAALDAATLKRSQVLTSTTSTSADIGAADAAVAQAQAALLTAQNNLTKVQGQQVGADISSAQQGVESARTALTTAQNNLAKLLTPQAADLASAQQAVSAAQATLSTAQGNLDKLQHPNPDDVAQLQAALDRSKAALDTAQTNWDRLVNGVDLAQRPETTALKSAQSDYQSALAGYNLKASGPKPGDVGAAQANIDSGGAALAAAQARLAELQAGSKQTDIQQQQEVVNQLELAVKSAQNDLDNATLKAPFAGTVVSVGVSEGDQATATTTVATLIDPNLVRIDATLDEASVAKVKAGQQAIVTFDAIPGRTFTGQVAVVTPAGVTQQGVVTFPITVVFNAQGATIPSGVSATVRIVTDRRQNALVVPSRAIKRRGRDVTVDVITAGGKLESRPVQVGITSDQGQVEILSGLNEGDKIAVPSAAQQSGQQGGAFGAGGLPGLGGGAPPRR